MPFGTTHLQRGQHVMLFTTTHISTVWTICNAIWYNTYLQCGQYIMPFGTTHLQCGQHVMLFTTTHTSTVWTTRNAVHYNTYLLCGHVMPFSMTHTYSADNM